MTELLKNSTVSDWGVVRHWGFAAPIVSDWYLVAYRTGERVDGICELSYQRRMRERSPINGIAGTRVRALLMGPFPAAPRPVRTLVGCCAGVSGRLHLALRLGRRQGLRENGGVMKT